MWKSIEQCGDQLWESLGEKFRERNKDYKKKMKTGDVSKWDTTALCKIFLFSDLKFKESSSEFIEIDKLRKIRNEFFAHPESMACSSDDFEIHIKSIKSAVKKLFGEDAERKISAIEKSPITQTMIEQSDIGKRLLIILFAICFE